MEPEKELKWLFVDMNSYFASVEQQETPSLKDRPVAVLPMNSDYTCVIAASYQAKAYGIKTGTRVKDAKILCPDLHCVVAQHDKYVAYHNKIIDAVSRYIPINKVWSIDEFSSRIPPGKRSTYHAQNIAQQIRNTIWEKVGSSIHCSIGISANSLLAKIAAECKKPSGLTIIHPNNIAQDLAKLNLNDVPGIGRNTTRRLHNAGIYSIPNFLNLPPKQIRKIWGSVEGERLWYLLHGYDIDDQSTNTVMVGHSRVLDPELRCPEKARLMARRLLCKACTRLRSKGFFAQKILLSMHTQDHYKIIKEQRFSASQNTFIFLNILDELWARAIIDFSDPGATKIKKISVILHDLVHHESATYDLLSLQEKMMHNRKENLNTSLLYLQKKYKKEVVTLGLPPKTLAGYVGTKIAFSRVPDKNEFWS